MNSYSNNYINYLDEYINIINKEDKGRYKSWEHCFKIFNDVHKKYSYDTLTDEIVDYLSLHLAFYLASWGMYRGSSFLLQKDYKAHSNIIKILFKDKYNILWSINIENYNDDNLNILFELINELKTEYELIRREVKECNIKNAVSITLVTKVLMGTLGCTPAYDRYFISGVRTTKIAVGDINKKSINSLCKFYKEYYNELENKRKEMTYEVEYPQMKILDMLFWQIGFDDEK